MSCSYASKIPDCGLFVVLWFCVCMHAPRTDRAVELHLHIVYLHSRCRWAIGCVMVIGYCGHPIFIPGAPFTINRSTEAAHSHLHHPKQARRRPAVGTRDRISIAGGRIQSTESHHPSKHLSHPSIQFQDGQEQPQQDAQVLGLGAPAHARYVI